MNPSILLAIGALVQSVAAAPPPRSTIRPPDRDWERFGLAERVQVLGDLVESDCPSVTLLRLRPEARLPPHSAPVDRTYLLLSGTLHVGIGKKWDEARMRTLPAGSSWIVPANTSTYERAEEEVVCQVVATRPARDCPRPGEAVVYTPDRLPWKPDRGAERAVLTGEPSMPGCPSVEHFRLPVDALAAPPSSPLPGNVVWTVLSGALRRATGSGETPGPSEAWPAGTVIVVPASTEMAGAGPTGTVAQRQFAGTGPRACRSRERVR